MSRAKTIFQSYPSLIALTLSQRNAHEAYEEYYTILHQPMTFDELCGIVWKRHPGLEDGRRRAPMANEIAFALVQLMDKGLVHSFEEEDE